MKKFLLTGGHGVLGSELRCVLNCWAPTKKELDIVLFDEVEFCNKNIKAMDEISAIIHCGAYTDVPSAEIQENRHRVFETNIHGSRKIKNLAKLMNKRTIYISSDYVYPGVDGDYRESDQVAPFNIYGFSKLAGESFFYEGRDLVIRTSFKPRNLWVDKYKEAFVDVWSSADYADVIANDIALLCKSDLTGIVNVGTQRKTIYQLARETNRHVIPIEAEKIKNVKLPRDISMNLDKFMHFKHLGRGK